MDEQLSMERSCAREVPHHVSPMGGTQIVHVIDDDASRSVALRRRALDLWSRGALTEATAVMREASAAARRDPMILAELGCLLRLLGDHGEAMRCFADSLEIEPRQTRVWLNAASLSADAGDKGAAEEAYRQALEIDPSCAEAEAGLGLIHIELRRYSEGAHLLARAVEHGAVSGPICACLGQARYLLGQFSGALVAFARAARLLPGDAWIRERYALAALVVAVVEESAGSAIASYPKAAGDQDTDVLTACRAAFQALVGFGPREAAIRLGEAILARAPRDPVIEFHLDALTGKSRDRAPPDYLVACFDKYASEFDWHLVEVLEYRIPQKAHSLLVELDRRFHRILDMGCGTGLAAPFLASLGADVTGVDISSAMLARARERGLYRRLVQADAPDYLSNFPEPFDLIVAFDVLIYFGDLEEMFSLVAGHLEPGGVFAFSFETTNSDAFELRPSGRFAHSRSYIDSLRGSSFSELMSVSTTIRIEANQAVDGRLVILQRT